MPEVLLLHRVCERRFRCEGLIMSVRIFFSRLAAWSAVCLAMIAATPLRAEWLHYAGDPQRSAAAPTAPRDLSAILWIANRDLANNVITFAGPSSPVVFNGRVYVAAQRNSTSSRVIAFDQATGQTLFEAVVKRMVLDSWSSPAMDVDHNALLFGSGDTLYSIDAVNGTINWQRQLNRSIVNASALVVPDHTPGRVLITDYDGFGPTGSLYAINSSPFDAQTNPFQPGDIVWQEPIGGSSGNSPAYYNGIVYVASVTDPNSQGNPDVGQIYAFNLDAAPANRRLWATGTGVGFFGGVTYANGNIFAASYNLAGSGDNSTLVKIRATDGALQWSVPCERTASIPVVSGDHIFLSAGLPGGFGSAPKVQAFQDHGTFATKLWDTAVDTSGALSLGGWTHQPIIHSHTLFVGKIPTSSGFFGPYTDLFMLDTTLTPNDSAFVVDHLAGLGSSPAASDGRIYTLGAAGLHAIGTKGDYCGPDDIADGLVNGEDIQCFVDALLSANPTGVQIALGDFDADNALTVNDVPGFLAVLVGP